MKFENNNKEIIKRITNRTLKTNKIRNTFAIMAIVLTTFMISSVFSIGISFAKNYKTMNIRLQGTTANVVLSNPTDNQIEKIKSLDLSDSIGYEINAGKVSLDSLNENRTKISIKYLSKENFEKQVKPSISDIKGNYPTKENEIMASKKALEFLGESEAKIGDKIKVPCNINGKIINKEFILSGYYTNYALVQDSGYLFVSEKFVNANSLSLEDNGLLYLSLKPKDKSTAPDILEKEVSLNKNQEFSFSYGISNDLSDTVLSTMAIIVIISLFIVLSGYLLIYNILYIAVNKDITFYGMLKTIGTSPKQIKKIVKGQALKLSLIGIPLGLLLGAIVSFLIVPLAMGTLFAGTEASAMPRDVSFNPIIFIGAGIFSLVTVMISCKKPAKIAGNISPIEALRYSGSTLKNQKKNRRTTKGSKLYKMAWYNVFREKKRAIIVFLSLFMGIITFLSVNTFLNSISVENYIDRYVKNDFLIQSVEGNDDKIDSDFINKIKDMKGVNSISLSKSSNLQLDMSKDVLLPALENIYERFGNTKEDLNEYLNAVSEDPSLLQASVIGIDDNLIERLNEELEDKIDVEEFKKGNVAIADSWYYPENYKSIKGDVTIRNSKDNKSKTFNMNVVGDTSELLPPGLDAPLGIPTIYISNSALEKLDNDAVNYILNINVNKKYESKINKDLKALSKARGLWFESKSEKTEEFNKSQMVMNILGGGIAVILILIGILNFINVMITGVNIRLKEFAIMESIGMTKKQIKMMLTYEGLYYALITTGFILTLGIGIIYGIGELSKNIADYAAFVFPTTALVVLIIVILTVCLITPAIVFKVSTKKSVTERLREIEN
ncbi:ABC transporter permease [Romboutsia ilealis]|uniref:ABC transporter permease n=1 Tax=Romboutsia faecis TaxID=2764597 RepID=A0ABR7JPR2_9FIRM|nr:ABC transporter permease [Romboutsia faecis]MBC5996742.1 ABC transporter permease [Romboutsia faecis]MRN24269.1 ABC transporter permease [Romboutsia ilealis]